jgi:hypothetical protein
MLARTLLSTLGSGTDRKNDLPTLRDITNIIDALGERSGAPGLFGEWRDNR